MSRWPKKEKPVDCTTEVTSSFDSNRSELNELVKIANKGANWKQAKEVLTPVKSIQTIFPQIDLITKVNGWPLERWATVHGPSSEGKTCFCLGLGRTFLQAGHFFLLIDAEHTTPEGWLNELLSECCTYPTFMAKRPLTYEETADDIRTFLVNIIEGKKNGLISPEVTGLIVIDSIRKLNPKGLLNALAKGSEDDDSKGKSSSKKGIDGANGRAGQRKAAMNAAWLDELVPLLGHSGFCMIAIAREREDPDAGLYDEGFKVSGGTAIFYDSSLTIRICREKVLKEGGDSNKIYGERHRVEIRKTKIGNKSARRPTAFFHTSNGEFFKVGFLRAMDVFELAIEDNVIDSKGAWFYYGDHRWNGQNNAVKALDDNPALLAEIEKKVRSIRSLTPAV